MPADDPNPHKFNHVPGSWDPPFQKWVLGVLLPVGLAVHASQTLLTRSANIPVLRGRFRGFEWMPVEGAQAIFWGLTVMGLSLLLHGRYHWRHLDTGWRHSEAIQGVGALVAVVSLVTTYSLMWWKIFGTG